MKSLPSEVFLLSASQRTFMGIIPMENNANIKAFDSNFIEL